MKCEMREAKRALGRALEQAGSDMTVEEYIEARHPGWGRPEPAARRRCVAVVVGELEVDGGVECGEVGRVVEEGMLSPCSCRISSDTV